MRTSKSCWVSKNVLLFAKSPKFDYENYHEICSCILSTIQIYSMMVNYLFFLLNGYEIMHRKRHSKQHSLSNIANLASNNGYIKNFAIFFKSTITFHFHSDFHDQTRNSI